MSEPTLYQVPEGLHGALSGVSVVDTLVTAGVLVPVERCEHGNIDGHWASLTDHEIAMAAPFQSHEKWCPGAGIGDNDDT